jgi:hypothetical protein
MPKANAKSITVPAADLLTPDSVEYVDQNLVRLTLKSETGDPVTYTMTSSSLVKSVNLAVALINRSPVVDDVMRSSSN